MAARANQDLNTFINNQVRPTTQEMASMNTVIDQVVRFLHNFNQFCPGRDYRVSRVVKSGSLGKGTAVQNKMDADLVVFMQGFSDMRSFLSELPDIISRMAAYIQTQRQLVLQSTNSYMVKCKLRHNGRTHDVDILPAVDLLATRDRKSIYEEMARQPGDAWSGVQSHYSVCMAQLQLQFVKSKADSDSRIKDLIRLVKYWSKEQELATVSYCLELICIKVFQKFGANAEFNMARFFKLVMQQLADMERLEVNFNDNYNSSSYRHRWSVPYVMDPANPFNNTLPWQPQERRAVASAASRTLAGNTGNRMFNFCPSV